MKVEFTKDGFYFVTCPDCADDREQWASDYPIDVEHGIWNVPCRLCLSTGDLCAKLDIDRDTTPEQLEAIVEARRDEIEEQERRRRMEEDGPSDAQLDRYYNGGTAEEARERMIVARRFK
jgi:hypothetical protein